MILNRANRSRPSGGGALKASVRLADEMRDEVRGQKEQRRRGQRHDR